jgi:ribosomal protein S18 acetylase RimI-like enzyme
MEHVQIKQVGEEDLQMLREISRETFLETFSEDNTSENMEKYLQESFSSEKLQAELSAPHTIFYFALLNNQVIGYLKLNQEEPQENSLGQPTLEIERIYVRKAFHGQNVGRVLLEKAFQVARESRVAYIWLGVWENNHRAIYFYRKHGFEVTGSKIFLLGEDPQTDFIMRLHFDN